MTDRRRLIESWHDVQWPLTTLTSRVEELEKAWAGAKLRWDDYQELVHILARFDALLGKVKPNDTDLLQSTEREKESVT